MKKSKANPAVPNQSVPDQQTPSAPLWQASKRQAVQAASRQIPPPTDARQAFGFMPMSIKGAAIRWRGL